MRKNAFRAPRSAALLALALVLVLPVGSAAADKAQLGGCASFVKRLDEKGAKTGISRPDLYEGLSGWLSMKAGVKPDEVHAWGRKTSPDPQACAEFGLEPHPLLALDSIVTHVPPEKVRPAVESCLAALKVIEDAVSTPGREAAKGASAKENRVLVKLLGYLARDKKPAPGAVESQAEAIRREAAGDLRSNLVFGSALASCGPLGVDVALLARIRASL